MMTDNIENQLLKTVADAIANENENMIIFFANKKKDGSINYICRSNSSINAGLLMKKVAQFTNGNGGGSSTFAQGGTKEVDNINSLLEEIKQEVKNG